MICAYFHKKDLPILSILRLIPVDQILDIAENIDSYPILKLNEVFMKIIFKEIEPNPLFNFRDEIQKVNEFNKLLSFKKLVVKKFVFGRVHAIRKIKKLRNILERLKKEEAVKSSQEKQSLGGLNQSQGKTEAKSGEGQTKLNMVAHVPLAREFVKTHSNLLVILQDKVFILVLREIYNMNANVEIYRNLTNILPDKSIELLAKVMFRSRKGNAPFLYKMLSTHSNEEGKESKHIVDFLKFMGSSRSIGDNHSTGTDFSFEADMISEKSMSLLNFDF